MKKNTESNDDTELLRVFGLILKGSRDDALDISQKFKRGYEIPQKPTDEQSALIELIKSLDQKQFDNLAKSLKFCVETSLGAFIEKLEGGVADYQFELIMKTSIKKMVLIDEKIDLKLRYKFLDWFK